MNGKVDKLEIKFNERTWRHNAFANRNITPHPTETYMSYLSELIIIKYIILNNRLPGLRANK